MDKIYEAYVNSTIEQIDESSKAVKQFAKDMETLNVKGFIKLMNKHLGTSDPSMGGTDPEEEIKSVKFDGMKLITKGKKALMQARFKVKMLNYDEEEETGYWFIDHDGEKIISVDV